MRIFIALYSSSVGGDEKLWDRETILCVKSPLYEEGRCAPNKFSSGGVAVITSPSHGVGQEFDSPFEYFII